MLLSECDALRGIVTPAAVLTGETKPGRCFRPIDHRTFPVFIEEGAELLHFLSLSAALSAVGVRQRPHREGEHGTAQTHRQNHEYSLHAAPLAAVAYSLSLHDALQS